MNIAKAKISLLLFVLFVVFYISSYSPKMYVVSFLLTTFFILLEKTKIMKGTQIPFKLPFNQIILTGILVVGFLYLYNKFFKREGFQDTLLEPNPDTLVEPNPDTLVEPIQIKEIEERLNNTLNKKFDDFVEKNNEVKQLSMKDFQEPVKTQFIKDTQNLRFNERKYKVQAEIEELEERNIKKQTPLDKKNLLLFKQNLVKQMPEIIEELTNNANTILYKKTDQSNEASSSIDKILELIQSSFTILNKDDRMIYVGTSSLIISFALMLFDISL